MLANVPSEADRRRLEQIMSTATGLPTLPGVAMQIIAVVNDVESDIAAIVNVIQRDPALTAKLLRVANSPVYGSSRGVETLRQAVVRLGLRATQSLALSFSLVSALRLQSSGALDYNYYWRRCLLSASAGKYVAEKVRPQDGEAVFLASLMQDLGMLVLDRAAPSLYESLSRPQSDHSAVEAHELHQLRVTHPLVGEWMMREWGFSQRMQQAVAFSHRPESMPEGDHDFVCSVALSALLADVALAGDAASVCSVLPFAESWLSLTETDVIDILQGLAKAVPSFERIFDTRLLEQEKLEMLSDLAREKLAEIRNLAVGE